MSVIPAGASAPPFELPGIDGGRYSLQEALREGPVLAAFFKISCPTSQFTFPFLQRIDVYKRQFQASPAGQRTPSARSFHSGLMASISAIFHARRHLFSTFSRLIPSRALPKISK